MYVCILGVAHAYGDRLVLESVTDAINNPQKHGIDSEHVAVLKTVRKVFALNKLEENMSWYASEGLLSGAQTRLVCIYMCVCVYIHVCACVCVE